MSKHEICFIQEKLLKVSILKVLLTNLIKALLYNVMLDLINTCQHIEYNIPLIF